MKREFKITGMSCQHCVTRVEKGLNELSGVTKVKVNLKKERAAVKFDEAILDEAAIVERIVETGYAAEVI